MGAPATLRARLRGAIRHLAAGLVEREEAARLLLLSALAGEHALFLGPPGTAKSELARRLHRVVRGGAYFERLLTRFSVPEELFGPLSIKALEQDRYHRLTASYLPAASVAFLDEVFKANSAILNALLSVLHERLFDNGAEREAVPLVCLVAASNEVPEGDELRAVHDRFLVRCHLGPVSDGAFEAMLAAPDAPDAPEATLAHDELAAVRAVARDVAVPAPVLAHLRAMRAWLGERKVYVSDRRWRRVVRLLQTAAWTDGRDAVSLRDCALAVHCVWERPDQREAVAAWHRGRLDDAERDAPARYERLVEALERQLDEEGGARVPRRGPGGALLYTDPDGNVVPHPARLVPATTPEGDPLYFAPARVFLHSGAYAAAPPPGSADARGYTARELLDYYFGGSFDELEIHTLDAMNRVRVSVENAPLTDPARYAPAHVEARLAQVADVTRDLADFLRELQREADAAEGDDAPLWSGPELAGESRERLERGVAQLSAAGERLRRVRAGFAALPREGA